MIRLLTLSFLYFITSCASGQVLYVKTFGNPVDKPAIFLHGGPGYNCASFEATTAQKLADTGLFVMVYDRRGEGRSTDANATYTYQETFDDIIEICRSRKIEKVTMIAHSFGGIVATLFAESYPEMVQSVILVGAPMNLQESFITIRNNAKAAYEAKGDSLNRYYVDMLATMDTTSLQYSSYCFVHAMQSGLYKTKQPTEEAKSIYALFATDSILKTFAAKMTQKAPAGFWENEKYTTVNLTEKLKKLKTSGVKFYALYGKEDGLYSPKQISDLEAILGKENLLYLDNCSHSVFVDQQTLFIDAVKKWAQ